MRMNGNLINTFCIIFFFLSKKVINAYVFYVWIQKVLWKTLS